MTNYNEQILTGSSWTRCRNISIFNPLSGYEDITGTTHSNPYVIFNEENITLINNKALHTPSNHTNVNLVKQFDPQSTIPVLNPQTGEPTGQTITHADLYVYLYSLYLQTAQERDAQLAAQQNTTP